MHEIMPGSGDKQCISPWRICCAPVATATPRPKPAATATPKPVGPTATPRPTATPTPSCINGKTTQLAVNLTLPGIGAGTFNNPTPKHQSRTAVYVKVTDQHGNAPYNRQDIFAFGNGKFGSGTVSLGTTLVCGNTYKVTVKLPTYLPVSGTVTYGVSQTLNFSPYVGDINGANSNGVITGDGQITVLDYNLVRACHNADPTATQTVTSGSTTVKVTCGDLMNFFDYPDGGTQGDEWSFNYNLWLRNFIAANGYKL